MLVTRRSRTAWIRLNAILHTITDLESMKVLKTEDAQNLGQLVSEIVEQRGGLDLRGANFDLDDPAGGGLAEHAFSVVSKELIRIDPGSRVLVQQIQDLYPHGPDHPR
jgi:hypothetical protein